MKDQDEQERREGYLRRCGLPAGTDSMTFERFQRIAGLEKAYDAALQLADGAGGVKWLTLMGGVDLGKTHLAIAICHRWLARGMPARYAYVPLLLDELRRGFELEGERSYDSQFQFFCSVPLLVLDDLGTESATKWVEEKLDTIIDYRCVNGLALVVTTNLPLDALPVRIASRLQRSGRVVVIDAPEYRLRRS